MNKINRIKELVELLNGYRYDYYIKSQPKVPDEVYDRLFDELSLLENETEFFLSNSPTQSVGFEEVESLGKVKHSIPLLSLDKTKSIADVKSFAEKNSTMAMLKLDGLTVELCYENGELIQASTRGDGNEGENITHNAKFIKNIPLKINYKQPLKVTGEAFISRSNFEKLKEILKDSNGNTYKNPRNLASGAVRALNSKDCAEKQVEFRAFSVIDGLDFKNKTENLKKLEELNFSVCKYCTIKNIEETEKIIEELKQYAESETIPIDGIVFSYTDIEYSKSLGRTGHHYKDGIAFKFEDELFETVLNSIEWNTSKTGLIVPVAIFNETEIDGSKVTRASLHNISFIEDLRLKEGNRILVSKRNMIIPHVEANLDYSEKTSVNYPEKCPCCEHKTELKISESKDKTVKTLYCTNPECSAVNIKKFVHFVSKQAMNIQGLSEATITSFIELGLVKNYADIYSLNKKHDEIVVLDGFGERSFEKLIKSIEASLTCTFDRFLNAMNISQLGKSACKTVAKKFATPEEFKNAVLNNYDFSELEDFGEILHNNIVDWFKSETNNNDWDSMCRILDIKSLETSETSSEESIFYNKTVVVTGKLENFTRDSIKEYLEKSGAKVTNSVSKKTDYLIAGADAGSKLQKAIDLNIPILKESEI